MFKGRGKRNMTTNWRDTGRDGASFVTTSNNNFDGGAPLHSPVGDVTPRRGDPKLVVADRHQASVVSDCDTDSTGGIPVTIRKVTNKGKHKGEGRAATSTHKGNMKAGSDEIDTATQKTNMANFAHHQLGIQSGDVSLRNGHVDGVADQLGQGKPIPNLNITNMPNDTHSPLAVQHVPSSHVKNDTTQTKLDMVPKTLSKQTDVTTRSKLSPIAETFVPCNLPVQIMQVQNGIAVGFVFSQFLIYPSANRPCYIG